MVVQINWPNQNTYTYRNVEHVGFPRNKHIILMDAPRLRSNQRRIFGDNVNCTYLVWLTLSNVHHRFWTLKYLFEWYLRKIYYDSQKSWAMAYFLEQPNAVKKSGISSSNSYKLRPNFWRETFDWCQSLLAYTLFICDIFYPYAEHILHSESLHPFRWQ